MNTPAKAPPWPCAAALTRAYGGGDVAWRAGMLDVYAAMEHGDPAVTQAAPATFRALTGSDTVRPADWFHAAQAMF